MEGLGYTVSLSWEQEENNDSHSALTGTLRAAFNMFLMSQVERMTNTGLHQNSRQYLHFMNHVMSVHTASFTKCIRKN